ncbi:MAG: hypothetical protein ACXVB9_07165 [Bdellovibrionota bacterium]
MRFPILMLLALLFAGCASVRQEPNPAPAQQTALFAPEPSRAPPTEPLLKTVAPKVLVVTLFAPEAKLWIPGKTHAYEVPGAFSPLYCDDRGVCMMISGRGVANTAASVLAVGASPKIDLRKTFILEAGIAGGRPNKISLGSVAWVEWAVNGDSSYRLDRDELPSGFEFENFQYGCLTPWCDPGAAFSYDDDVFRLNHALIEAGLKVSSSVNLVDTELAKNYRSTYPQASAQRGPAVQACDLVSGDTFFHGKKMSDWASWWLAHWSKNQGDYCVSAMEEPGLLLSLKRLAGAGRVDFSRIMVIRSVANYDQPRPGQGALESLGARANGHEISFQNVFLVGSAVVEDILRHGASWGQTH